MGAYTYQSLSGKEILPFIRKIGEVRIVVFRDFPYLYDGDLKYEEEYLETYSDSDKSFVFTVSDGNRMVGVTTALPLSEETNEVKKPFEEKNIDVNSVCYFGESILLPEYRGQGIGHLFFDKREEFALENGFSITAFCAVDRAEDHPLKPGNYRPNDAFWKKRGYEKQEQMSCIMTWKDIDEKQESPKSLTFWLKKWK